MRLAPPLPLETTRPLAERPLPGSHAGARGACRCHRWRPQDRVLLRESESPNMGKDERPRAIKNGGTSCRRRFGDQGLQKASEGRRTSCPLWGWPRGWPSSSSPTLPPATLSCVPHICSGALMANIGTLSGSSSGHSCLTGLRGLTLLRVVDGASHCSPRKAGRRFGRWTGWRSGAHVAAGQPWAPSSLKPVRCSLSKRTCFRGAPSLALLSRPERVPTAPWKPSSW